MDDYILSACRRQPHAAPMPRRSACLGKPKRVEGYCYIAQEDAKKQAAISRAEFEELRACGDMNRVNAHPWVRMSKSELGEFTHDARNANMISDYEHEITYGVPLGLRLGPMGKVTALSSHGLLCKFNAIVPPDKTHLLRRGMGASLAIRRSFLTNKVNGAEISFTKNPFFDVGEIGMCGDPSSLISACSKTNTVHGYVTNISDMTESKSSERDYITDDQIKDHINGTMSDGSTSDEKMNVDVVTNSPSSGDPGKKTTTTTTEVVNTSKKGAGAGGSQVIKSTGKEKTSDEAMMSNYVEKSKFLELMKRNELLENAAKSRCDKIQSKVKANLGAYRQAAKELLKDGFSEEYFTTLISGVYQHKLGTLDMASRIGKMTSISAINMENRVKELITQKMEKSPKLNTVQPQAPHAQEGGVQQRRTGRGVPTPEQIHASTIRASAAAIGIKPSAMMQANIMENKTMSADEKAERHAQNAIIMEKKRQTVAMRQQTSVVPRRQPDQRSAIPSQPSETMNLNYIMKNIGAMMTQKENVEEQIKTSNDQYKNAMLTNPEGLAGVDSINGMSFGNPMYDGKTIISACSSVVENGAIGKFFRDDMHKSYPFIPRCVEKICDGLRGGDPDRTSFFSVDRKKVTDLENINYGDLYKTIEIINSRGETREVSVLNEKPFWSYEEVMQSRGGRRYPRYN